MTTEQRLPPWIKARFPGGPNYLRMQRLLRDATLHTVCEEAHCPNIGECFESRTATFLILGDICTRNCAFCAVRHGPVQPLDWEEPERVAQAVATLDLRYTVITSVTRDDLPDGGAEVFALTISKIRERSPGCRIEVLIPDLGGSKEALYSVLEARPDVLNHNLETVARLYPKVRPQANYQRSLELLSRAKEWGNNVLTKSGIMVGLGETLEELHQTMMDLHGVGCDILTVGQYLRPSSRHVPIERFYTPAEFEALAQEGHRIGFLHVEAGALVRSSYHAANQSARVRGKDTKETQEMSD